MKTYTKTRTLIAAACCLLAFDLHAQLKEPSPKRNRTFGRPFQYQPQQTRFHPASCSCSQERGDTNTPPSPMAENWSGQWHKKRKHSR